MTNKRRMVLAGVAAGVALLGFLALRFGPGLIEPFLPGPSAIAATGDSSATQPGGPDSASGAAQPADTGMIVRYGPFVVEGRSYRIEVLRDTGATKPRAAGRQVQVFNDSNRVVYVENLFLRRDSTALEEWIEFHPSIIEDDKGRPRAFDFTYAWIPSAPSSGVAFHIVAPRGDSLVVLTQALVGFYGAASDLLPGNTPGAGRLLPGNQLIIRSNRGWVDAFIPLRVDVDCVPRSGNCVRFDLKDSVGGLARFPVLAGARQRVDTAVTIEIWLTPHGSGADRITIPAGQEAEILGGAGRVFFERVNGLFVTGDDEWLQIKVNGRIGWITGADSFTAIGLQQAG